MMKQSTESAVLEWYENNYNTKPLFAKQQPELTLETSLSTGKYPWAPEAGDEIMKDYFSRFGVDDTNFTFIKYWPVEKGVIPNFIRPKSLRVKAKEPEPLTIAMLIESAKAGKWLYD